MKKKVITGSWDGKEIWREETPEETLARELGVDEVDLTAINLYKKLNEISQTRE